MKKMGWKAKRKGNGYCPSQSADKHNNLGPKNNTPLISCKLHNTKGQRYHLVLKWDKIGDCIRDTISTRNLAPFPPSSSPINTPRKREHGASARN